MADDLVASARQKLDDLVREGVHSFNEGRTDEALAIAETALLSDPASTAALALAADCYVRKGDTAAALERMERVVELNPDSELDKIKRNQLRSQLMSRLHVDEPADRRLVWLSAVSAALIVLCLGAIAANFVNRPVVTTTATNNPRASEPVSSVPTATTPAVTTPATTLPQTNPTNPVPEPTNNRIGDLPKYNGQTLPIPVESGNTGFQVAPVNPMEGKLASQPESGGGVTVAPKTNSSSSKPGIDPEPGESTTTTAEPTNSPERDTGVYDIKISTPGTQKGQNGNVERPTAGGAEALMRTGVQQYQLGNYNAAAGTLERALGSGADPVSVNQRLGQAYEKLGKAENAATAYKRAIAAGEAAIAGGKGNRDRIQSAVDVCRQALRVLQGG